MQIDNGLTFTSSDRKRKSPDADELIDADADDPARAASKRRLNSPPPRHHVDGMEDDADEDEVAEENAKTGAEVVLVLCV